MTVRLFSLADLQKLNSRLGQILQSPSCWQENIFYDFLHWKCWRFRPLSRSCIFGDNFELFASSSGFLSLIGSPDNFLHFSLSFPVSLFPPTFVHFFATCYLQFLCDIHYFFSQFIATNLPAAGSWFHKISLVLGFIQYLQFLVSYNTLWLDVALVSNLSHALNF